MARPPTPPPPPPPPIPADTQQDKAKDGTRRLDRPGDLARLDVTTKKYPRESEASLKGGATTRPVRRSPRPTGPMPRPPADTSDGEGMLNSLGQLILGELEDLPEQNLRQRALLLQAMGTMEELLWSDAEGSLARYQEAYRLDPAYLPAVHALRRRLEAKAQWDELAEVLEAELRVAGGEARRSEVLTRLAQLQVTRQSDTEGAVEHLRAALDLNPRDRSAALLLRVIYTQLEQWEGLLELLRGMAGTAATDVERARLLVEMAELCEHRMGRPGHAEGLYHQAMELAPDGEVARLALRRLYFAHHRWRELTELLTQEGERGQDPEQRFTDLCRAARLAEHQLQDEGAAAELLEQAASLRSNHPLPLQLLEVLYQRSGRHQDLAATLARHARLVTAPADRASLNHRRGRVLEDWLDQPAQAVDAYREALREQPDHEATARALGALYRRLGRWDDLLDLDLLRAERAPDPRRRADGYLLAAQICERPEVQDPRRALDLYERAYRLAPGQVAAFQALQRLYQREERWDALSELYEREAGVTGDRPLAHSLLRRAAWIQEQMLDNRAQAIAALEQLSADDEPEGGGSGARETTVALARLYQEAGRMEPLARVLERWAEQTEDAALSTELQRQVGELLEGPLRQPEQAVVRYRSILEQTPGDRLTLDRLKSFFERKGRWTELVQTLGQELEVVSAPQERALLLLQQGQVTLNKLGGADEGRQALERAVKEDPGCTPAQLALEELLRAQGLWDPLVELLEAGARRMGEPAHAAAQMYLAGEVCEEQFQDRTRARRYYERALDHDQRLGAAVAGLVRIHQDEDDLRALEALYRRGAERGGSKNARVRSYLSLGALLDGKGDARAATKAYEAVLAIMPDQPDALQALARLHRRAGQWELLCKDLIRLAGQELDSDADLTALRECAVTVESHLMDRADPGQLFERLLEGDPSDLHALETLDRRAHARRDRTALVSLARLQVQAGGDGEWIAAVRLRLATLLVTRGELEQATEVARRALTVCPGHLPTVWLLRLLAEHLNRWEEAAELLLTESELASSEELRHDALLRAGDIFRQQLGELTQARQAYEQVFEADPAHEQAFARLTQMLSEASEWRPLAEVHGRRLASLPPQERVPGLLELTAVHRDRLQDPVAAAEVLEQLLAIDPEHHDAIVAVTELCVALKRWRDAEQYLKRLAALAAGKSTVRRSALMKRARVLEEQLQDPRAALEVLQQLLTEYPNHREALTRSAAIYQQGRDWGNLVAVLDELVRGGPPAERVHHLVALADVHSRCLKDEQRAQAAMRRAAAICVQTGAGIDRVTEFFERRRDHNGLVAFLGKSLEGLPPEGSPGAVPVRLARARVMSGRLLQADEAEQEVRRALEHDPGSVEARLELAALQLMNDRPADATAEYMTVLDHDPFSVDAFRGLHQVYVRRGDLERAAGAAQAVCFVADSEVPERTMADQAASGVEAAMERAAASEATVGDVWHLVADPEEPQVAPELLRLAGDHLHQVFATPGAEREQRLTGGAELLLLAADQPLGQQCATMAGVIGVERFQCWTGDLGPRPAVVLPGNPHKVVLHRRLTGAAPDGRLRFILGRAMATAWSRSHFLELLDPEQVELLLLAVVELHVRGNAARLGRGQQVEELAKAVNKAVPRKVRKRLEEPVRSAAVAPPVSADLWIAAAARSAARAALLVSGDVGAALEQLVEEGASKQEQSDLLRFAVGPHLYEARHRLGLLG